MKKISVEALKNQITKVVSEEEKEDAKWAAGLRYALKIIDEVIDESEGELKTFKVSNQEPLSNKDIKVILGISEGGE